MPSTEHQIRLALTIDTHVRQRNELPCRESRADSRMFVSLYGREPRVRGELEG
jgi:hypothetical protein